MAEVRDDGDRAKSRGSGGGGRGRGWDFGTCGCLGPAREERSRDGKMIFSDLVGFSRSGFLHNLERGREMREKEK